MLTKHERETIILFNESQDPATIFTYSPVWQRHLEGKLGLRPTRDNGHGGKEYTIAKGRIPMPRVPQIVSAEEKARRVETGKRLSAQAQGQKSILSSET